MDSARNLCDCDHSAWADPANASVCLCGRGFACDVLQQANRGLMKFRAMRTINYKLLTINYFSEPFLTVDSSKFIPNLRH